MNKEIKMINIEMQCIVYNSFADRTLFYWAKLHASQDSVKANYTELKPTIGIYIVKNKMFEIDKFHLTFSLLEKTCYIEYSKNLEMHVLQLSANLTKEDQNLLNWNKFFNIKKETDINNIKKEGDIMKQLCEALESFNYDEQEKIMALSREKAVWEKNFLYYDGLKKGEKKGIEKGRKEGEEEGIKKGIKKAKEDTIKEMLLEKLDINLIAKISKLSIQEIEKIKKELN